MLAAKIWSMFQCKLKRLKDIINWCSYITLRPCASSYCVQVLNFSSAVAVGVSLMSAETIEFGRCSTFVKNTCVSGGDIDKVLTASSFITLSAKADSGLEGQSEGYGGEVCERPDWW